MVDSSFVELFPSHAAVIDTAISERRDQQCDSKFTFTQLSYT